MNDINDNGDDTSNNEPGFFGTVVRDKGVQSAAAGTLVAIGIAVVKTLLFSKAR